MTTHMFRYRILRLVLFVLAHVATVSAQFNVEGDFRARWYHDTFSKTMDNRAGENYIRYLARLRGTTRIGQKALFATEVITLTDNPGSPARNIAGTGTMRFGISQLYAEIAEPDFLLLDVVRLRVGRQQFPIGEGLSFGEAFYFVDKFDGGRLDLSKGIFTLSLFGAITGQNVSASGIYPDPGSDQIYAGRLGATVGAQDLMLYGMLNKPRGDFNDSYILGGGASGTIAYDKLLYSAEFGYQKFHQAPGFPAKGGIGYLGTLSYQWSMGPFRSIKVETRYAAFQGDDPATPGIEQFSPPYSSFFWGVRSGYVNGEIGGDFPWRGSGIEGSRIWFSRVYVIPSFLPKARLQVQYVKVSDYITASGYNHKDDEVCFRLYYALSPQVQAQARYAITMPNGEDRDLDGGGTITSTEDRYQSNGLTLELLVRF